MRPDVPGNFFLDSIALVAIILSSVADGRLTLSPPYPEGDVHCLGERQAFLCQEPRLRSLTD